MTVIIPSGIYKIEIQSALDSKTETTHHPLINKIVHNVQSTYFIFPPFNDTNMSRHQIQLMNNQIEAPTQRVPSRYNCRATICRL